MHFESAEYNNSSLQGSSLVKAECVQSWATGEGLYWSRMTVELEEEY